MQKVMLLASQIEISTRGVEGKKNTEKKRLFILMNNSLFIHLYQIINKFKNH